jgi:very-short-patch-repair endonuclease
MERNTGMKGLSQQLRKEQTKEENLLWYRFLRTYPLQFRRQYVIGSYIVDFYCHKARLAIELDGSQHYEPEELQKDRQRTAYLETQGVQVLRFTNLEVLRQFDAVCEKIDMCVKARTHTLPRGEGAPEGGG